MNFIQKIHKQFSIQTTLTLIVIRGAIIFCRILAPVNAPPPPDATILNYLNDREAGVPFSFVGFWRPPPLPQTPQYLITILMAERGGRAPISRKKLNI